MRLTTNLATRVYLNIRVLNVSLALAFALLALLLLWNGRNLASELAEMGQLNKDIALLEKKSSGGKTLPVPQAEYKGLLARMRFANGVIERKSLDWLKLLDRLEEVVPDGITIVAIDPSLKDNSLKLAGAAKRFANLRTLMENLEDSRFFTRVYLLSQSDVRGGDGGESLEFNIICKASFK